MCPICKKDIGTEEYQVFRYPGVTGVWINGYVHANCYLMYRGLIHHIMEDIYDTEMQDTKDMAS